MRCASRGDLAVYGLLSLFVALNIGIWSQTHAMRPVWGNVPPATSERGAEMMAVGDRQLAYRMTGIMLQNLGNTGGVSTALYKYNFAALKDWFFLADALDPVSNYVPQLAAFYFGATQNKDQLTPVIEYLQEIGLRPENDKWRWLAQAVYLARYQQGDMNKSMQLAETLAKLDRPNMPIWAKTMPAFVMRAQGDKQAAYTMMMGILANGADKMDIYEIRFIRDNICNQILTPAQAAVEDLCLKVH